MNQLAIAIQRITSGNEDLEDLQLTASEKTALKVLNSVIGLAPVDIKHYFQESDDPLEWLSPLRLATD